MDFDRRQSSQRENFVVFLLLWYFFPSGEGTDREILG
ncbi:hypothetical protein MPNT_50029 [Candidatus Methylacidithermus pantelleriae]|uniref:Uncharacterized protein n=1 Tax=Candidatus Methylacidithermus pantelleriae TaxID=2744239 RepID=A0A8J2BQL5_9BACT|nr:hypothetical protein MPNT_50029 [Candidatus Methylacidithermus pantelleriae]